MTLIRSASVMFFSRTRRHTRLVSDWSSDVCSSDLGCEPESPVEPAEGASVAVEREDLAVRDLRGGRRLGLAGPAQEQGGGRCGGDEEDAPLGRSEERRAGTADRVRGYGSCKD